MLSYVFMKILEMRPRSYDRRMEKVSRGRTRKIKEAVAELVPERGNVLEIGCGTGELAGLIVQRGCIVEGFDLSPSMVRAAAERREKENLRDKFSVKCMGVEGMDDFPDENFDVVVATLAFSELNDNERRFALKHAARVLRPGGRLIIADEVVPRSPMRRLVHSMARFPLLALTYLVTGTSTRPLKDLSGEIEKAELTIQKENRSQGDSFALVVAIKKDKDRT
ncbi:MAG: class I SAM-dependent methyltransferase [Deltaproteobacteria bacterium]|nr:class I SAM-dependent methyltransferase [Deltaproteobacteria bacterium]